MEPLSDPKDHWQILKLRNGLLLESGRPPMGEAEAQALLRALAEGRVSYLVARRSCRAVGMRSLPAPGGTAEVFIEPAFRGRGVEEMLAEAALEDCLARGPGERPPEAEGARAWAAARAGTKG